MHGRNGRRDAFLAQKTVGANKFQVSDQDFRDTTGENVTEYLNAQLWGHTATTSSIGSAQSGEDKVHLAINQSRRRADGSKYDVFSTRWTFTKFNERWGVQFPSSVLSEPVPPSENVSE